MAEDSPKEIDLNSVISKLLNFDRCLLPREDDVKYLCTRARAIFLEQPILLELDAPLNICGDIHGQLGDLIGLLELGRLPPKTKYLFLGDYVDRGKFSLETICLLLAFKIKYPENFFLLRGNHEDASINKLYGFFDDCKRTYDVKIFKMFTDCFDCMPIAAIVSKRIFAVHGGLSPELRSLDQIRCLERPLEVPETGLVCDLLWSDPQRFMSGWGSNPREVSFTFGADVVEEFLKKHDLDLVCRAHQVVEDGYEFFANKKLITVFSARNYCGEFRNNGAMLCVDGGLGCSIKRIYR